MELNIIYFNNSFQCSVKHIHSEIFFSLMDYRNNYFTSDNPDKIIEFYNGFENREQIIRWMEERPKGVSNVLEVDGNKDIIVVIPTVDFDGKFAKECRESIYKGLHIIFVESGIDFYFNYAHNCNVGIRKAMAYNPKWVVVSNDDITSPSKSEDLIYELSKINNRLVNVVLNKESKQSATKYSVCKFTILGKFIYFNVKYLRLIEIVNEIQRIFLNSIKFNRKLGNKYFIIVSGKSFFNLFIKRIYSYYNFEAFGIFSGEYIKNNQRFFDETYINAHEDQDVSIILNKDPSKIAWITNYRFEGMGGVNLGTNLQRGLRTVASDCYLNYKLEQGLLIDI